MQRSIDTNDRQPARLVAWRDQSRQRLPLRVRVITTGFVVAFITAFFFIALRPLATDTLTVIVISNTAPEPSRASSRPLIERAASNTSAQFQQFAASLPAARVRPRLSLGNALNALPHATRTEEDQSPLLIHAVGCAAVHHQRAMLFPTVSNSDVHTQALDVTALLRQLDEAEADAVIVIDTIEPSHVTVGRLPEMTHWQFCQSIDNTISRLENGRVRVVVGRSEVPVSGVNPYVSLICQKLMSGFDSDADANRDHLISADELTQTLVRADSSRREPTAELYSNVDRVHWRRLKLGPVMVKPVAQAETSKHVASEHVASKHVASEPASAAIAKSERTVPTPASAAKTELDVTAPTLSVAQAIRQLSIFTRRSDECDAVLGQLQQFVNPETPEAVLVDWLAKPTVASMSWDEVLWARTVVGTRVDWKIKQDLLRCRLLANQLVIEPTCANWLKESWTAAQWTRLDAERSATSPVRHDNAKHVHEKIRDAIRQYEKIERTCRTVAVANRLCRDIRQRTETWVAAPIRSRTLEDDLVFQLLKETIELSHWLTDVPCDSMHQCESLIESITERRAAAESEVAMTADWLDPSDIDQGDVGASPGDRYAKITRIRIARSSLALELQAGAAHAAAVDSLRQAAKGAEDTCLESTATVEEITDSLANFQLALTTLYDRVQKTVAIDKPHDGAVQKLNWVAADSQRFASDADDDERVAREQISDRCRRLAAKLGATIVAGPASNFAIDVTARGSLVESEWITLDLEVEALSEMATVGLLEVEVDSATLLAEPFDSTQAVAIRHIDRTSYGQLATRTGVPTLPSAAGPPAHQCSVRLRRSDDSSPRDTSVNVRWVAPDQTYRTAVPIEMPLPAIARIHLAGMDDGTWILSPNRTERQALIVEALREETKSVRVRLLGWPDVDVVAPPPMSKERADRWYSRRTQPTILATFPSLAVSRKTRVSVPFEPQKLDPSAPKPPIGSLICEMTDLNDQTVQMINISPRVLRPASLLQPTISYDATSRIVTVSLRSDHEPSDAASPTACVASVQLHDQHDQLIDQGDITVAGGQRQIKRYSVAGAQGNEITLRIAVNDWPNAFLYRWSASEHASIIEPSDEAASIDIITPQQRLAVKNGASPISAAIAVEIADSEFRYGKDRVTLGLDLNGDRFLADEPTVTLTTPVAVQFAWAGVDQQGRVGLTSHVGHHRVPLDVGWVRNQQAQLVANLQRGDHVTWSPAIPVVFDGRPPKIVDVQLLAPDSIVLGAPVQAAVKIDDGGLSGAASVKAGWSTSGQQEFTPNVKPVAGQVFNELGWRVQVPTDGLLPGTHALLFQAVDRAGNMGEVLSIPILLPTVAQLAQSRRERSTAVRGKVNYVKLPVPGVTVTLKQQPPEGTANSDDKQPPTTTVLPPKQVQTDSDGGFVFSSVKAGDYELRVEGLYRGMRRQKRLKIAVRPPVPTAVPTIRID